LMYLTPASLCRTFAVQHKTTDLNARGGRTASWQDVGTLQGVPADASPDERLRWEQMQHPVTHTVAARGPAQAQVGDRLVLDGRHFYVQAVENPGGLDLWTLYRCEERKDA